MSSARPKGKQPGPEKTPRDPILIATWILSAAVVLLTIVIRIRLLEVPLERDEGEFAYMGQLILKGIAPYKVAYNMKLPGIYGLYALIMAIFGQTAVGIHIGLLLANLAATILLFILGRRLWNTRVGLISAASYPVLTLGIAVCGTSAHATQFQMPMVLGGMILIFKALESGRRGILFWSGLLMGLAVVTKQQALLFMAFGGCYLIWQTIRSRTIALPAVAGRAAIYAAGAVVPFAVACLAMLAAGVFDRFWFWTFTYAREYAAETPLSVGLPRMIGTNLWAASYIPFMTALAGIGLIAVLWDARARKHAVFAISFFVVSYLTVCLGFYFRGNYYVQVMPALSLLIGLAVVWIANLLSRLRFSSFLQAVPLLLFLAAVTHVFWFGRSLFFAPTVIEASRAMYGCAPFPESLVVARYLREHTKPTDRIAVLGSEPQIYFYTDRPAATGYIYTYSLVEPQPFAKRMQQEMIREIETAKPRYIVYANVPTSWQCKRDSDASILQWFMKYATEHYRVIGLADIITSEHTEYFWGEDAAYFAPNAIPSLVVFERKDIR